MTAEQDGPTIRAEGRSAPRVTVTVMPAKARPLDLDTWIRDYVAAVLRLEGLTVPVAIPTARSIG